MLVNSSVQSMISVQRGKTHVILDNTEIVTTNHEKETFISINQQTKLHLYVNIHQ